MADLDPYSEYLSTPDLSTGLTSGLDAGTGNGATIAPVSAPPDAGLLNLIVNLPSMLDGLVTELIKALKVFEEGHPLNLAKKIMPLLSKAEQAMIPDFVRVGIATERAIGGNPDQAVKLAKDSWQWFSNMSLGSVYRGMLEVGLGIDTTQFGTEANRAVDTTDTMMSFAFMLPLIATSIGTVGQGLLGHRWSEAWHEFATKISEEMGLSWALGLQIDEAYKVAVGRAVEEAINKQKRGNRIDWPQLRLLLTKHMLTDKQFQELMELHGFPDDQINLIRGLNTAVLPVGDIAQLWYRDDIDDKEAVKLISENGFSENQSEQLFNLYMAKAENQASVAYRTEARAAFTEQLITEDQYRHILSNANYPKKLIDGDVAAIKFLHSVGHVLHSVTEIKSRYQHHTIDGEEAARELQQLNYSKQYITELLQSWDLPPIRRQHGLSQSKILSYFVSGVLTEDQARSQLAVLGLSPDAINTLIAHPSSAPMVRPHKRTPGLVITAYVDGAILDDGLDDALLSAGADRADLPLYRASAEYRRSQRKGTTHRTQYPGTADVEAAQKAGLLDFQAAVATYEALGWSPDWAMIKAEIINKGPYVKPGPPIFPNDAAAIAFLTPLGYKVTEPPDPRILDAIMELVGKGYGVQYPIPTLPGVPPTPNPGPIPS